ncbi:N-acetylmuramoyl-L-alanine amidase [Rubellimicrobium rubrum]|uniref:N-acetylmuramoyl-L-alanine amidase n=2 Tax=Rubellimicrobium rubrum TaxID=2585369 RepID=A0A5C4MXI4_9RHOB|nr:N-acetylmuramoyl-L-alanine amidase [Rubellimicrobium rubrum]
MMLGFLAWSAAAQDGSELSRIDPAASRITDAAGDLEVTLALSRPVPWRIFTLEDPLRLILELRGAEWAGTDLAPLLQTDRASAIHGGTTSAGWSQLTLDLTGPVKVNEAGMAVSEADGSAVLRVVAGPTDLDSFSAASGAPADEVGAHSSSADPTTGPEGDARFTVAIDPGHGGIDPGAEREGLREAHAMLSLGQELARALEAAGIQTVLTRSEDVFVSLQDRMSIARAAGADVLLSLHADALRDDNASGASIYTLTAEAGDQASERMVERHESGDLLAGLDLQGQDDSVATALMDLARLNTSPRSEQLARTLADELGRAGAVLNSRPLRQAPLAVLNAADFPSVLIEVGFLSDPADRARLASESGRSPIVAGITNALAKWQAMERDMAPLLRR